MAELFSKEEEEEESNDEEDQELQVMQDEQDDDDGPSSSHTLTLASTNIAIKSEIFCLTFSDDGRWVRVLRENMLLYTRSSVHQVCKHVSVVGVNANNAAQLQAQALAILECACSACCINSHITVASQICGWSHPRTTWYKRTHFT